MVGLAIGKMRRWPEMKGARRIVETHGTGVFVEVEAMQGHRRAGAGAGVGGGKHPG